MLRFGTTWSISVIWSYRRDEAQGKTEVKKKKMLIVNNQAGSKEPMKEGGKDQNKIKTSNQASIAPREELGWEQWTTGKGLLEPNKALQASWKTADNLREQVQWTVAEKDNWLKEKYWTEGSMKKG